ncbi:hypothetical protein [Paraburkholderia phytofirmans]|uniref:hypothetical protein n=1 Tax=Paraburkholderia phytofirmans TaxID=261302 RepID=UPI0038BD9E16
MRQKNTGVCELGEMTLRELAGLHILNEALREAERWIRENSVREQYRSESDSNTAGPSDTPSASDLPTELTLRASVVCMSGAAEPCNAAAHNHVARLEAIVGQISARVDAKEIALAEESLFGLQPCALFRTLIAELRGDWLQVLEVRALKVELTASACREFEVASVFVPRRASNFPFRPARRWAYAF